MKLFVYNKKDKIFLIGILVIIVLLIITSIISCAVLKDKEISTVSSLTESASEDNSLSESAVYTDETTDTTVSSIRSDTSVTETTAPTDKSLSKNLSVKEIQKLIESLTWTGYTRPDHTDEDKYTLKVSGDTWVVKVSGKDTVKYQIKLNSATLPVGIWTTYHIPCTITYNDKTLESEFTLMENDGKLILSCDALVCNGFKSIWE